MEATSSYPQRNFPTSCLCRVMEYFLLLVLMMYYSLGFGGASSMRGNVAVILGVAGLNFFLDVALFLFSVMSLFLTLGLVSGSGGLNWLAGTGIGIGTILFSTSREVFHLLDDSRMQVESHAPGFVLNQLGHSVPPNKVHPLH